MSYLMLLLHQILSSMTITSVIRNPDVNVCHTAAMIGKHGAHVLKAVNLLKVYSVCIDLYFVMPVDVDHDFARVSTDPISFCIFYQIL